MYHEGQLSSPFAFGIQCEGEKRQFLLSASSEEERDAWLAALVQHGAKPWARITKEGFLDKVHTNAH